MFNISNKTYDFLSKLIKFASPVCIFIVAIAKAWGLNIPVEAITATIAAITALVSSYLAISSKKYYAEDGEPGGVEE